MGKINSSGLELIKEFEGFSSSVYKCSAGKQTIGYGHVLLPGELFPRPITKSEGEAILTKDVKKAEHGVDSLVHVPLTENQFSALVSFVFNVGINAFRKSTLLRLVNSKEHEKAAQEFKRWVFAGKKRLKGLERRREAESRLYLS
jgi:lysozyme